MSNQFAMYDTTVASPQPVKGWYDNTTSSYPTLPPVATTVPAGFIAVTDAIWAAHVADLAISNWTVVSGVVTHKATAT